MMNIDTAKENMIQHQIRPIGISDTNLLAVLHEIPKEAFFPKEMTTLAYSECEMPVSDCQNSLSIFNIAKILQFLSIKKDQSILQVGCCDNGYLTALLAKLASNVELYDINEAMVHQTKHRLKSLGIYNVKYRHSHNWSEINVNQSHNIIILAPVCKQSPETYLEHLAMAGCLLYFVMHPGYTKAMVFRKTKKNHWESQEIADFYNNILSKSQQFVF